MAESGNLTSIESGKGAEPPSMGPGLRALLVRFWPELAVLTVLLAAFSILPVLGLLWLGQQGVLPWWLILCAVAISALALLRLRSDAAAPMPGFPSAGPGAAAAEVQARQALAELAATVTAEDLASRESIDGLLQRTLTAVASVYAPRSDAALLNFTLPEGLLMLEEVARRLRLILSEELPVLRHVRLSWAVSSSGLIRRGAGPVRGLANAWRLLRWSDPLGALVAEVRALVIEQGISVLGREARAVVAAVLVREVGGVAIDLYSGAYRARVEPAPNVQHKPAPRPLRVLVAGQRNSGKSSLINALAGRELALVGPTAGTTSWAIYPFAEPDPQHEDDWELIDSPPVMPRPDKAWLDQAREADLVLWVAAAHRADRGADQRALGALRGLAEADSGLRPVPLVLALTHADRLEPALEWRPPYDPVGGKTAKELSMARALHVGASALGIDPSRTLLLALRGPGEAWNLMAVREQLAMLSSEARQKSLERARRPERFWKTGIDLLRSVPGALERARHFLRR